MPVDQEERAEHGNNGEVTPEGREEGRSCWVHLQGFLKCPFPAVLVSWLPYLVSCLRAMYAVSEV